MNYGEVWLVDFNPQVGAEVKKTRPAIIVSNDTMGALPLKIVVPVTDPTANKQMWHVHLTPTKDNGLAKPSVADCFQAKSISKQRFVKKLGKLNEDEISDIKVTLMAVLDLI